MKESRYLLVIDGVVSGILLSDKCKSKLVRSLAEISMVC